MALCVCVQDWVARDVISGRKIMALAVSEPHAGSDVAGLLTTAVYVVLDPKRPSKSRVLGFFRGVFWFRCVGCCVFFLVMWFIDVVLVYLFG